MKEKALRDTQIRNVHEMGEMNTAEELRFDELFTEVERKSWNHTEAHFTSTRFAREVELHEWFHRISRDRFELEWKHFLRSQPTSSHSKSTFHAKPRQTLATWHMEFVWTTGKRFWQSTSSVRFITDTLSRNSSLYDSKCDRCSSSASKCRATCCKRSTTNCEHDYNADVNHVFFLPEACHLMEFVWDTGKRFWQSTSHARFITDALSRNSSLNESKCHRWNPSAEKYMTTCPERRRTNWKHNSIADVCRKAVNHEFFPTIGNTTEFYGWTAKTTDIWASVWETPHSITIHVLEDKIQNPSKFLFRFFLGGYVMDQRSEDGRFTGRI